ncbi:hypothetical protein C8Q75DRAFT_806817 [Abortiporus biennis]|nr:hypothetical protein C8Q75DRAFT_806817 [Abortiporus biennis]
MEPSHDVKAGFNIESRGFSEHSQISEAQDDSRDQIPNGGANDIEFGISDSNESAQGDVYQEETKDTHEQEHLWKGLEGWSDLSRHLRQYDEERIKRVNDDMDTLLVFAGLFSAVVTAFCIEFYKSLQTDPNETSAILLLQISKQLASFNVNGLTVNSSASAAEPSLFTSKTPSKTSTNINIFWFLSLVFSLTTASLAMLVKQWLREYLPHDNLSPQSHIRVRHFRAEGIEKFHVFTIAAVLPLMIQIALGLFFIGLVVFLIDLDWAVGWSITPFVILWASLFVITLLAPAIFAHCPYHTPLLKGLLHTVRYMIHKNVAYIYNFVHLRYGNLKWSAREASGQYRRKVINISSKTCNWLYLVSHAFVFWGSWVLYSVPHCFFGPVDTTWRSEDLYFYEDDHPFRDERWARENNSMNATCLASIDAMFMDDQYLSFIFVAARNMDFEDIVAIYRFIYSERKGSKAGYSLLSSVTRNFYDAILECLLRRKKLVLTYDFDSQHPDLHGVLGELFISVLQESYPKDEVITLFNMFLRQSPYSALLVVRICINPLVSKYDACGEFFNKIEVDSVSAIRHLIKAVSDEIASHPSARHKPDDDNDDNSPFRPPSLGDPIEETDNSVPIDPVNQLELLYYFTFSILARADEQLLTRFDTRKFLAQAVGQLRMLFSSSITSEDWELLEKRLLSRENTTPSQEYREAIDKLRTLLLTRIKEEAE